MGLQQMPKKSWRRGTSEVDVPDYMNLGDDGQPLSLKVTLDPDKDFLGNAKACFKQAGKIDRAIEICTPLIEAQQGNMTRWRAEAQTLAGLQGLLGAGDAAAESEVRRLYLSLVDEGLIRIPEPESEEDPEEAAERAALEKLKKKYGKDVDRFVSPSGFEVLAGRSSTANERVTWELTWPDSWWFHTDNGIPGSHVTIRANANNCTDEDIEFAAGIAAWHSKARTKMYVPVMYCYGNQLKKPPRRKTGQVSTTGGAKSIDVRPCLPEE
ncbi:unnamed protein product [Polarella glacialis]|uniref:NFACT RNA-binding domain-containing protein n=3 Tax=Polarella glacialis TaxID=89957 RepID=A0A813F907_POLGL|nr:unnamed protein product [Polarella glacialis]